MDIPIGATVICTDGHWGKSSHVIINPITQALTHVVVCKGETCRLVPFEEIAAATPQSIALHCRRDDVQQMENFIKVHYIENILYDAERANIHHPMLSTNRWPGDSQALYWPYVTAADEDPYLPIEEEQIPPGELALRRGTEVWATDGRVGKVDELMVDTASGHITHFVLQQGSLWGRQEITVPISMIQHLSEYRVELKLDRAAIADLPKIPVRRFHQVAH